MKSIFTIFSLLLISTLALSQTTSDLNYQIDGAAHLGFVAKPAKINKKTKTILIVHEWWGLNQFPKERAVQLAKEGFIAVCIDMYGANKVVDNPTDAGALAGKFYADPMLLKKHFDAGYQAALTVSGVNKDKMAAIGFCFGGTVVLNAAKMGAPVDAVVSFHGGLQGPPLTAGTLKAAILVCNGAADQFVPQKDIDNLSTEMKANSADYTFINYADATHAFTNPYSTEVGKKFGIPIAYNKAADEKSYADFLSFMKSKVK